MAHSSGTMNLVFQDTHGNYLKLQPGQNKTVKAIPQETVKALLQSQKAQVVSTSPGTVITTPSTPVYRALNIGKSKQIVGINMGGSGSSPVIVKDERVSPTSSPTSPSIILQHGNQFLTLVEPSSLSSSLTGTSATSVSAASASTISRKKHELEISDTVATTTSDFGDFYPAPGATVSSSKRRKTEKGGKGLRHFSMKVCEKVRNKRTTTYNEVADELVAEFTNPNLVPNSVDQQYDQKNIRRRVYDALNVLMAMNIISKEKKEIRWIGLPTSTAQECVSLLGEKKQIAERIKKKTRTLNELLLKQISMRSLIQRNVELEKSQGQPAPNTAMHLPFIVVNSDRKTVIDCSITNDKTEYQFVFNGKFEINDHDDVLRFIGLTYGLEKGTISEANLEKVKNMLPKSLEKYVINMATNGGLEGFGIEEETEVFGSEFGGLAASGEFGSGLASEFGAGPSSDLGGEEDSRLDLTSDDEDSLASTDT